MLPKEEAERKRRKHTPKDLIMWGERKKGEMEENTSPGQERAVRSNGKDGGRGPPTAGDLFPAELEGSGEP